MALPLSERQARAATRWLVTHFREPLQHAVEGTPFSVELLCGIACQETAFLWLPLIDRGLSASDVLARSIGDASGDAPNTTRSAFPQNTAAFQAEFGAELTDMLIEEANASRQLRGFGPKRWVYKGYGLFQYDLQHIRTNETFFREKQWHEFEHCLANVVGELTTKFRIKNEIWATVKAYNGSGPRAEEYKNNVQVFTEWARDEIGRALNGPAVPAAAAAPRSAAPRSARRPKGRAARSAARGAAARGAARPASRPQLTQDELRRKLEPFAIDRSIHPLVVVGIRGYYRDTLGAPGVNDRGIYDDAILIDAPGAYATFNGNTDPSKVRVGAGTGAEKGMASLNAGVWYAHRFDLHNDQYLALCQRLGQVTVTRDGTPPYPDTGMFGINIHKGGFNTTSSLGCQTIHPEQWPAFIELATDLAKRFHGARWNDVVIPYVLIE